MAWVEALKGKVKGDTIILTGRLRTESYDKDGTRVSQLGLVCATVHPIASRAREESDEDLRLSLGAAEHVHVVDQVR